MSIQEIFYKFKRLLASRDPQLALLIVVVGIGSFFLGRASLEPQNALEQAVSADTGRANAIVPYEVNTTPARENISQVLDSDSSNEAASIEGGYVASKNGTKYHLPWCSGAQRIKEENKVWFKTKEEAEAAGYSPAANCKGI